MMLTAKMQQTGIKRLVVEIWGTGSATREFFYIGDTTEAISAATESYDKSDPVDIGAGFEHSIKGLITLLVDLMKFDGEVMWDQSRPDWQPRKMLDATRAKVKFDFTARTGFREGLVKTVEWYTATKDTK